MTDIFSNIVLIVCMSREKEKRKTAMLHSSPFMSLWGNIGSSTSGLFDNGGTQKVFVHKHQQYLSFCCSFFRLILKQNEML